MTKVDQNAKNGMLFQLGFSVVPVRVFCCFSLGLLLYLLHLLAVQLICDGQ